MVVLLWAILALEAHTGLVHNKTCFPLEQTVAICVSHVAARCREECFCRPCEKTACSQRPALEHVSVCMWERLGERERKKRGGVMEGCGCSGG